MVGSAPESSRQVSNDAASAIAARLSLVPDLKLPGQLTRDGQVSDAKKSDYLMKLIQHDPGVFLERHGDILEAEECAAFQLLRSSSYEVDFHLKILEYRRKNPPQNRETLSTQVKNRRLAAMRNLMLEGEHFSEDAMRHRHPYLYNLHVGQYTCTVDTSQEEEGNKISGGGDGGGSDNAGGACAPLEASTLARSLMRQQEEVDLMVRIEEERELYDEIEREQEAEEEEEEEKVEVEVEVIKGVAGDAKQEGAAGGEIVPIAQQQNADPLPGDESNPSWWGGSSGERITQQEREANLESFRDIMQQKFLAGEDTGTINYVAIDANQEFDLSEEAVRDAEETYFDTD